MSSLDKCGPSTLANVPPAPAVIMREWRSGMGHASPLRPWTDAGGAGWRPRVLPGRGAAASPGGHPP